MTAAAQASMTKGLTLVIGIAFILTIIGSPIGVVIIWLGRKRAKQILASGPGRSLTPEEQGLVQSWDDVIGPIDSTFED